MSITITDDPLRRVVGSGANPTSEQRLEMNIERQYGSPKYLRDITPGELAFIYNNQGQRALIMRMHFATATDPYFFPFEEFDGIKPFEICSAVNYSESLCLTLPEAHVAANEGKIFTRHGVADESAGTAVILGDAIGVVVKRGNARKLVDLQSGELRAADHPVFLCPEWKILLSKEEKPEIKTRLIFERV